MPSRSSEARRRPAARRKRSPLAAFSRELSEVVSTAMRAVVALSGHSGEYICTGSGFVIDRAGHVVTNAHVVEGVRSPIDALLHGGRRHPAALIGVDPLTDLALLRLEEPSRHHLTLRRSPATLGEMCLALGNPCGRYPETVTLGIVSGVAR
ncbi:MAG: S1C family serine protease, partial [Bacteroidales bacterium]